jgi:2-polyprenyl-3-methyl-5-hydroxy-6-metoxy-1,4-benzoquinol methylase
VVIHGGEYMKKMKKCSRVKRIENQKQWASVSSELEQESVKLQSYDHALLPLLGSVKGRKILDYGAGPGVLASVLANKGAAVRVFDISKEMRDLAGQKIGVENVYDTVGMIPQNDFDVVICNLVLCIVPEREVANIVYNIQKSLKEKGRAFVGFCNPRIFDVPESKLDLRNQTGQKYEENHVYRKVKKEGDYEILELHRPIEWYLDAYHKAGLEVLSIRFTPEYELKGRKIQDFVLFELAKRGEK